MEPGVAQPLGRGYGIAQPADSLFEEPLFVPEESSVFGTVACSLSVGAVLGYLSTRRQQASAAAAVAAVALSCAPANAMVDYENIQFLGGSDKVDINNANIQSYRQFPGMYPTAAGFIAANGPYQTPKDIYNIPGIPEIVKSTIAKYEDHLLALPVSPAYFIDRINNGVYK